MPYRLIYNPTAGGGRAQRVVDRLTPRLADVDGLEVTATREPGHAVELARAVSDQEGLTVISVGGDGTHHEVVNGLLPGGRARLAIIPAGSGNDFAGSLNIPNDPTEALSVALGDSFRFLDIGAAELTDGTHYFLTVTGAGFDAEVAALLNSRPKGRGSGSLLYLRGIIETLLRYQCEPMAVESPSWSANGPTLLVAVGNTPRYAGGIRICPDATPDDGLFEVVWIRGMGRLRVLSILARAYQGTHVRHALVETRMVDTLSLSGPSHLSVHADGEILGHLPATIRVVPAALPVLCPAAR
jgi:diacylglycerol kinase (ATP)